MAKNYVQKGDVLTLTAPAGGVTSGTPVFVNGLIVVPEATAAATEKFAALIVDVVELDKTTSQVQSEGDEAYWDTAASKVHVLDASLGPRIGVIAADAASADTKCKVRLDGVKHSVQHVERDAPAFIDELLTADRTLTAAEVIGTKVMVFDCGGAGRTITFPTAALLVAGVKGGAKVGDVFEVRIRNGSDAAESITLAAGTGGAFGTNDLSVKTIVQNDSRTLFVRISNVTAAAEAYLIVG